MCLLIALCVPLSSLQPGNIKITGICLFITSDINECTSSIDDCHKDAVCSNTDGAFTCSCKGGFSGDGRQCAGAVSSYFLSIFIIFSFRIFSFFNHYRSKHCSNNIIVIVSLHARQCTGVKSLDFISIFVLVFYYTFPSYHFRFKTL